MIGSINLVVNDNEKNPGLNNMTIQDLQDITNGYVKHIDFIYLDMLNLSDRYNVLKLILQKLSIQGTTTLKFINLDLLGLKINKGEVVSEKLSEILPSINSIWSDADIENIMAASNIIINNHYYDNIYSIITIIKTK